MRVPVDSNGSQNLLHITQERKTLHQVKLPGVEVNGTAVDPGGNSSSQNPVQVVNNAILRLVQTLGMIKESVAGLHMSQPNVNLDEIVGTLVESINEVLRVVDEASKDGVETNKNIDAVQGCLCKLREIIVSAIKNQEITNELGWDFSSLGIKLLQDGLLDIDRKTLKDSLYSSKGDMTRVIKTISNNLFETLPLCIDPGSGSLVYTGKRIENDGDKKASKVLAAIDEELEKERTELDKRLSVADSLISYSNKLIDELKPQSEALLGEE